MPSSNVPATQEAMPGAAGSAEATSCPLGPSSPFGPLSPFSPFGPFVPPLVPGLEHFAGCPLLPWWPVLPPGGYCPMPLWLPSPIPQWSGIETEESPQRKRKRKIRARQHPPEPSLEEVPLLSGGVEGPLAAQDTLACEPTGWEVAVHDAPRRSFVSLLKGAFETEVLRDWEQMLFKQLPWSRPLQSKRSTGEARPLPRRACWLTKGGCSCRYEYSGTSFAPMEMPSWLLDLTESVCSTCGLSERPDACNVNLYGSGAEGVGWHADDEPLFQATKSDALIMSLSLGATRYFEVRPKYSEQTDSVRLMLSDGDLCAMEGLFQKHYRHCVPLEDDVFDARINLTWRWIRRHQPHCALFNPADYEDAEIKRREQGPDREKDQEHQEREESEKECS